VYCSQAGAVIKYLHQSSAVAVMTKLIQTPLISCTQRFMLLVASNKIAVCFNTITLLSGTTTAGCSFSKAAASHHPAPDIQQTNYE
jgi:hypothetical protein